MIAVILVVLLIFALPLLILIAAIWIVLLLGVLII